ncbi:hypothetical protein MNBD_UNCLBAC01-1536 [hydrothermal vent metagenome]|uniref:Uncharacterized protein n=1 Tax=hydrothermal vent metagenome TaxID=652676 RepID=A0A3B1CW56_9ZZZZ
MCALELGKLNFEETLVHIDQHTDMREPQKYLDNNLGEVSLDRVFQYTNKILNVGNFIRPALTSNIFKEVIMITNQEDFERTPNVPYALDLDMDIFSPEMNYISHNIKFNFIQSCLQSAKIITIATSPYFIKQNLAIFLIKELFDF